MVKGDGRGLFCYNFLLMAVALLFLMFVNGMRGCMTDRVCVCIGHAVMFGFSYKSLGYV